MKNFGVRNDEVRNSRPYAINHDYKQGTVLMPHTTLKNG